MPSLDRIADSSRQQHQRQNRSKGLNRPLLQESQKFALASAGNIGVSKGLFEPIGLPGHKTGNLAARFCEAEQRQHGKQHGKSQKNRSDARIPWTQPKPEMEADAAM